MLRKNILNCGGIFDLDKIDDAVIVTAGEQSGVTANDSTFFTTSAADNYTLTMTNSSSLGCSLYSDSGFTTYVSSYYNNCTAGTNLSETFTGSSSSAGLSSNTTYYLIIEPQASTIDAASTTTYNITVSAEGN